MTFCSDLNNQHAIPGNTHFALGPGPLPMAYINNAHASATISLLGGQILTFQRHGVQPTLWVSRKAEYALGEAIRGGVPIIFPWFGTHPKLANVPSHGLVRTQLWQIVRTTVLDDGTTQVVLSTRDDADTRAQWAYTFQAEVTITVGATLTVSLTVTNSGVRPFEWSGALHSYFSVGALADVAVDGLDGVTYQDTVHGGDKVQLGQVLFPEEVDRVYLTDVADTPIADGKWQRTIDVAHSNHDSVVVWNPGRTAVKADLEKTGYEGFVCVETGVGASSAETAAARAHILIPNQSYTFATTVR